MVFGKKRGTGTTVVLVDIESGSVAAALALLSHNQAPRLLGETRITLPLQSRRDAPAIASRIERALEQALVHVGEVSSRLRAHPTLAEAGEVASIAGFFSVPWAAVQPQSASADIVPHMADMLRSVARATVGEQPLELYPYSAAALHGALRLFPYESPTLVSLVNAETTELLLMADKSLKAHATLPTGFHTLLRTLVSHGGMSPEEARSYVALAGRGEQSIEPLRHAQAHFAEEFADVVPELLSVAPAARVLVMAPHPADALFARGLEEHAALGSLFPTDSTVRIVHTAHLQPYLAGHGPRPDLALMLEALFVDTRGAGAARRNL